MLLRSILTVCMGCCLSNLCGAGEDGKPAITHKDDVVYGRIAGAALLADIAFPASDKPLPAVISVHGGRWVGGHKRDGSTIKVDEWAGLGFVAMSIDYRLNGISSAPASYQDLLCALRFLRANAKDYNVDTNRIYLMGQSAGGQLTALAATLGDGPWPKVGGWDKESHDFRAAIGIAAPYDLTTLDWGKLWTVAGDTAAVDAGRALASPLNHIKASMKPLLIIHSDDDKSVPIGNVLPMVAALKEKNAPHKFVHYEKAGHMGVTKDVIEETLKFIREIEK